MRTLLLALCCWLSLVSQIPWRIEGDLLGKDHKVSRDASGIALSEDGRNGLFVDDEVSFAQRVQVIDGVLLAGATVELGSTGQEVDAEAVAYAGNAYYVVGSHGHPRDRQRKLRPDQVKASIQATSQLFRIRGEQVERFSLRPWLANQAPLKESLDRRLDEGGLTVEGLSVRDDRLYLGLRSPWAAILSMPLAELGTGGEDTDLHRLPVPDHLGIRDMAAVPGGLLVLLGPIDAAHSPYIVGSWADGSWSELLTLPEGPHHPEAILPLPGHRLLVLSDGPEQGAPYEISLPTIDLENKDRN